MKAQFLVALSLVLGCSATPPAKPPARVPSTYILGMGLPPARTSVDLSKIQIGEDRHSVVRQIGEPDFSATSRRDGAKCDVYTVEVNPQGTFRTRLAMLETYRGTPASVFDSEGSYQGR